MRKGAFFCVGKDRYLKWDKQTNKLVSMKLNHGINTSTSSIVEGIFNEIVHSDTFWAECIELLSDKSCIWSGKKSIKYTPEVKSEMSGGGRILSAFGFNFCFLTVVRKDINWKRDRKNHSINLCLNSSDCFNLVSEWLKTFYFCRIS